MPDSSATSTEGLNDALEHPETGLKAVLLRTLEARLKLPPAYFMRLRDEPSDWVFIVKLALLVEATLTEYIVIELGKPALYESISEVENARRLNMAVELSLIQLGDRKLLSMLGTVRNDFAHRVVNLNRTLADYASELPLERQKEYAGALLGRGWKQQLKEAGMDVSEWLPGALRSGLLDFAVLPLISMSMLHDIRERDKEREKWQKASASEQAVFQFKHRGNMSLQIDMDGPRGPGLEAKKVSGENT